MPVEGQNCTASCSPTPQLDSTSLFFSFFCCSRDVKSTFPGSGGNLTAPCVRLLTARALIKTHFSTRFFQRFVISWEIVEFFFYFENRSAVLLIAIVSLIVPNCGVTLRVSGTNKSPPPFLQRLPMAAVRQLGRNVSIPATACVAAQFRPRHDLHASGVIQGSSL